VPLVICSLIGGLITGWIAIGEGEIVAALLMLFYRVNVATCIGWAWCSCPSTRFFSPAYTSSFSAVFPGAGRLHGLGCVFGARLAPFLSRRSNPIVLKGIFAAIAICDGILFIVQYVILHHVNAMQKRGCNGRVGTPPKSLR